VVALGVRLLISGDDNHNAQVAVRYRAATATEWRVAMPLFRVHPESVVGRTVPEQFAGSIFDLSPGTTYEIELHATDPDAPVDQTLTLSGTSPAASTSATCGSGSAPRRTSGTSTSATTSWRAGSSGRRSTATTAACTPTTTASTSRATGTSSATTRSSASATP